MPVSATLAASTKRSTGPGSRVLCGSVASMDIPAPLGKGAVRPTVLQTIEGMEGVKDENVKPQMNCFVFTDGHGIVHLKTVAFSRASVESWTWRVSFRARARERGDTRTCRAGHGWNKTTVEVG